MNEDSRRRRRWWNFVDLQNFLKIAFCSEAKHWNFDHLEPFPGVKRDPTNFGPIGSAVLTFIEYKKTTDKQSIYIWFTFHLIFSSYILILYSHPIFSFYILILYSHPIFSSYILILYSHPIFSSYILILYFHPIFSS